jgi:V8-like Glu-specific endopeptidase
MRSRVCHETWSEGGRLRGEHSRPRIPFPIPVVCLFLALLAWAPGELFGQSKIVGGTKAGDGDYPWMVAIAEKSTQTLFDRQFCGGSLIAPDWVLTAAHCMEGEFPGGIEVVAGLTDLNDSSGAEIRGVRGIFVHPGYADVSGDLVNDIALILLDSPITTITPVAYSRNASPAPVDNLVRAIGWGDTQARPRFPTELQMVDLSLTSISLARRVYASNRLDIRHLAAMAPGKDTCGGDSGGPLFDLDGDNGNPITLGITSFGLECAERGVPGIYANVGNYVAWIDDFLAGPTVGDPDLEVSGWTIPIPAGSLSPSHVSGTHFGRRVRSGRTAIRSYTLSNENGDIPLSVNGVRASNRSFHVMGAPKYLLTGATGTITVRYRAPFAFRRGTSKATVSILTNDPVTPVYNFRVLARYR